VRTETYEQVLFTDVCLLDKKNEQETFYIDVNSEPLREILRIVLRNVKAASLREDKPAV
jgi:hypothetical protein